MIPDLLDPFKTKEPPPKNNWDEILVQPKRSGGGPGGSSRRKAEAEAAEAEEEDFGKNEPVPEPPPRRKPAAVLSNPQWGEEEGVFDQTMSVSVEGSLPPESSHVTRVTFTVYAILPDGKQDRIDSKDGYLDEGTATAELTLWTPNYRDADGNLLEECEYVFKAKHRDSKELESPKLPVTGGDGDTVFVELLDADRKALPGAKCRVAGNPDEVFTADEDGIVELPIEEGAKEIEIEWEQGDAGPDEGKDLPRWYWSKRVQLEVFGDDEECESRRLANLSQDESDTSIGA